MSGGSGKLKIKLLIKQIQPMTGSTFPNIAENICYLKHINLAVDVNIIDQRTISYLTGQYIILT